MENSQPTPLFGDNFEVVPEPQSKKLVIYFTATGAPPRIFNFWKPGNAIKTSRIFLSNARSWYQQGVPGLGGSVEETVETIRKWARHLGVEQIYTVGGSMGGYGAALFGCLLEARVMAFSFESELDFEGSRSRKLMDRETVLTHRDLKPLIARARQPFFAVIGERDAVDAYSVNRILGLPMVRVKSIKGVLHGPQNYLSKRDRLVPLLEAFIAGFDEMPRMPEDGDLLSRVGFSDLFYKTYNHHRLKQWDDVLDCGRRALAIMPSSDQCNWFVGEALLSLGKGQEAYPYLFTAFHSGGRSAQFYFSLANCLRKMELHDDAIKTYRETLKKWPEHAPSHYGLGLSYLNLGYREKAGVAFREAARLAPNNEAYTARARKFVA